MVELADTKDLKSFDASHTGSIPVRGTNYYETNYYTREIQLHWCISYNAMQLEMFLLYQRIQWNEDLW